MQGEESEARRDLEAEIDEIESQIDEIAHEQARVTQDQQDLQQEHQAVADRQSIRRAELQGMQAALEPERQSKMSALAAEEAALNNEIQRIQRDAGRPGPLQAMREDERIEAEDRVQAERDKLSERRAEVEDQLAKAAAELHGQMATMEVEATRANTEINEKNRSLQELLNRMARDREERQRRLDNLRARLNTVVTEDAAASESSEAERIAAKRAQEMEEQLAAISEDRNRLAREVKDLAPLIEAQRDATSAQGAQNLSEFYIESADQHNSSWRRWLALLLVAVAVAAGGGLIVASEAAPGKDADTAEIFHAVAVAVLVVGLLVYLVRVASLQFRVHRNLEAVDRSKAAALRTYNRIVAGGSSPEIRTTLVASLADAVFRTADPGFVDQSSDHVTLVERVVGSATQRASGSS